MTKQHSITPSAQWLELTYDDTLHHQIQTPLRDLAATHPIREFIQDVLGILTLALIRPWALMPIKVSKSLPRD